MNSDISNGLKLCRCRTMNGRQSQRLFSFATPVGPEEQNETEERSGSQPSTRVGDARARALIAFSFSCEMMPCVSRVNAHQLLRFFFFKSK